jgi:6-hydroxytryprostatin B O-methyltransferase
VKETKIFLLRHFLHNLPDPVASEILANVASFLKPGGRILIQDIVLPETNEVDPYVEGMLRMREMIQIELANGRTRTQEMWQRLIQVVGFGAKIKSMVRPEGSDLSLLEIEVESASS